LRFCNSSFTRKKSRGHKIKFTVIKFKIIKFKIFKFKMIEFKIIEFTSTIQAL